MECENAGLPALRQIIRSTIILMRAVNDATPNIATPKIEELSRRGTDLLAAGSPAEAVTAFRAAIALGDSQGGPISPAHIEAHHWLVRALRDAGRLEQAIGAALALTVLTPGDPLAHAALSISLQHAGHVPQAEAAAAKARVLEWKQQLQTPPDSKP